jgi:hypothetical protein
VAFVRSRGSPNFLQLGDSETLHMRDQCIDALHRSGQRVQRNGHQHSTPRELWQCSPSGECTVHQEAFTSAQRFSPLGLLVIRLSVL